MIQISISTNTVRKTVNAEVTATPFEVFEENNISTAGCQVYVDGERIQGDDFDETFEDLGVDDESAITISCIVKADSAV